MTQTYRWPAALALLFAFGACAVRAEEEEDPPRPRPVIELLPAPRPVLSAPTFIGVTTPDLPPAPWMGFSGPCTMPAPAFTPPGIPFGLYCPPCPPCGGPMPSCLRPAPDDLPQYVVEMKMVKAGAGEDDESVVQCPRVTVSEGQTAAVQLHAVESSKQRSTLQMQVTVTRQAKGAQLDLSVMDANTFSCGESGVRTYTETTEMECKVAFGKSTRVELKHDADGTATAWLEVAVTEVEREERIQKAACGGTCRDQDAHIEKDSDGSAMDCAAEVVEGVFEMVADTAQDAFGWAISTDEPERPSPEYLGRPAQYIPANPPPLQASWEAAPPCAQSCPRSDPGCAQCALTEPVKKNEMHVCIDAGHGRKCVEMSDGKKHFKASAEHIMVQEGCIFLHGDVHASSGDGSLEIHGDAVRVRWESAELKIEIDD